MTEEAHRQQRQSKNPRCKSSLQTDLLRVEGMTPRDDEDDDEDSSSCFESTMLIVTVIGVLLLVAVVVTWMMWRGTATEDRGGGLEFQDYYQRPLRVVDGTVCMDAAQRSFGRPTASNNSAAYWY
jgi:hypothetical protein